MAVVISGGQAGHQGVVHNAHVTGKQCCNVSSGLSELVVSSTSLTPMSGLSSSFLQPDLIVLNSLPLMQDHMANRMVGPHAHCNVFHPSYKWVFVPDLGDNCIHQYGYESGRLVHQTHVPLAAGDGPRHFVFHPTLPVAYSGCELRSHVQVRGTMGCTTACALQ
jgi:6-phosphogluconolactonase (cycloisomerase 2 family)